MFKRFAVLGLLISFYAPSLFAEQLDRVVAVVNDGVITSSELNQQVSILKKQYEAKNMQVPSDKVLRKQVLQHLIDVDLQLQLAKQNDITIDNSELNEAINKIAETNHISLSDLREAIEHQGISWNNYRENIRKEILLGRLQQKAIGRDITITNQQVEDYLKTSYQQDKDKSQMTFHLQNIVIPLPEEPTTEQLKSAQKKANDLLKKLHQGADFSQIAIAESSGEFALEGGDLGERHLAELPDVFVSEVVKMKTGQIAGPIRTGNGYQLIKLTAIGGDNSQHQVVKTHVRHILLKSDSSLTPAEASRQANNLYQQIKSGKDFALLAKQYSLDAASAVKGGDLGWVTPGELVPEFEKAMDGLPLHKVSKPVKSVFGWHLIEVLERKKVDDSASYQRQQVRQFLQQKKFTEAVQNWQQHLRTDAYIKIMDKELA
ncbi:peptidylprolyl isomerase [Legionella birminghamensis]|nr:peptidylprolyl isomerase [Legionella birminghamensis]